MKVTLDAGHGGRDSGAVGNGLLEKDIALSTTLKVGNTLNRHGIKVHYTRTTDVYVGLGERVKRANNNGSDIFVSIHVNSVENPKAHGIETLYYPTSIKGSKLALTIQNKLKAIATADRGIKPRPNLVVLNSTNMPAALTEIGFIKNKKDVDIITKRQDEVSELIAQGILEYLGVKYMKDKKKHWAEKHYENLNRKGIVVHEKRFDDKITRGEVIALIDRATDRRVK